MTTENKFYEYKNTNNGGRERVYRTNGKFFISSDWGDGFFGKTEVTRSQMEAVLSHTNAPEYVVKGILELHLEAARPKAQEARMTVQITEQDFYDMRNQRDNERLAGTAKDIEIRQLRQALTEANERIEYANAGDLVTIPRDLVLAMEAKMKEQAAEIERMTSAIEDIKIYGNNPSAWEHYDDGVSQKICALVKAAKSEQVEDACTCGHSLDSHTKSVLHPCKECVCLMFWADGDDYDFTNANDNPYILSGDELERTAKAAK